MSRISLRIISTIILCIIIVAVSIGVLSLNRASSIIADETYEKFAHVSTSYANEFSILLTGVEKTVNTISSKVISDFDVKTFSTNAYYRDEYMTTTNRMIKDIGESHDRIQGIYLAINPDLTNAVYESWYIRDNAKGFIYQEPEHISTFYPENEDMGWYYDPIREGQGVWSLPYTDATIDVKMISYTKAFYDNGTLIGVAGIDIDFDDVIKTIEEMKLYENGYAVLLDEHYRFIIHPELEEGLYLGDVENENFDHIIKALDEKESGVMTYRFRNTDKIMGFSKLSNNWTFMAVSDLSDINQPIIQLSRAIYLTILITVTIGSVIGLKMANSITKPLNQLHDITDQIGKGNFDISIDTNSKDEIGNLARGFTIMSKKLESTLEELTSLSKNLEFMAFHDALTHLPNRRYGFEALKALVDDYRPDEDFCGIMSIDLDDFKMINDTKGHDVGDMVLLHVSEMMNHSISANDILCRFGGDEFLVVFRSIPSVALVEALGKRLLRNIVEPMEANGEILRVSCSIGIAVISEENRDPQELLKQSDLAMYEAKKSGRNTYRFYSTDMTSDL